MNRADLELAKESDLFILGVVTWAPLADDRLMRIQLDSDSHENLVVGYLADVRDKHPGEWVKNQDVAYGIELITEKYKPLDLLLTAGQAPLLLPFIDAHPGLRIVLDHSSASAVPMDENWARTLREIGRRPHVSYRLSGLASGLTGDSAYELTESTKHIFEAALDAFGTGRLLYGSGWPTNQNSYPVWLNAVDNLLAHLSADERAAIYGNNAEAIYRNSDS